MDCNGDGRETLDDVLFAINSAAAAAGVSVTASWATTGNGIRLVDTTGVNGTLRVERLNLSYAVEDLGLAGLEVSGAGASVEVVGEDVNGITPNGVFTALHELYDALRAGDPQDITEVGGKIQDMIRQVNHVLGEVGARAGLMAERHARTEDAVDATRKALSEVKDLDYTTAITRFQQSQMALQANLMSGSQTLSLSLLDFIQ
jgi:flagellin-like hook-associated protein FlgL